MTLENTAKLKRMVSNNNKATFVRYFNNELWYRVTFHDECEVVGEFHSDGGLHLETFDFAVPISDIGNATFQAEEKALLLMRYIRKFLEQIELSKEMMEEVTLEKSGND